MTREPRNVGLGATVVELHFGNDDLDQARRLFEDAPVPSLRLDLLRAQLCASEGDVDTALDALIEALATQSQP